MSEWQSGPAPKDGSIILGIFENKLHLTQWEKNAQKEFNAVGWSVLMQADGSFFLNEEPRLWMQIDVPEGGGVMTEVF